jgi:hypothetical protein
MSNRANTIALKMPSFFPSFNFNLGQGPLAAYWVVTPPSMAGSKFKQVLAGSPS